MRCLKIICTAIALGLLAACTDGPAIEASRAVATIDPQVAARLPIESRSFAMGTAGYVPANFPNSSEEDWRRFFASGAADYGGMFGVHIVPGNDLTGAGVPEQVELAFTNVADVQVYVQLGVNHEHSPFTQDQGERLVAAAVATARQHQPRYLSLGVESNSLYLFQPENYPLYVEYVRRAYDEIKAVSPETLVMNNFQLERMRGATGLTGEEFAPNWHLIEELHGKIDMVSFTVYPFLHYRTVSEIPADYLAEIRVQTDLPLFITETGWPSEPIPNGVPGSPDAQIEYLLWLAEAADAQDFQGVIWVFPHDGPFEAGGGIFDSISLKSNDGQPKPAFDYWKALESLPHSP